MHCIILKNMFNMHVKCEDWKPRHGHTAPRKQTTAAAQMTTNDHMTGELDQLCSEHPETSHRRCTVTDSWRGQRREERTKEGSLFAHMMESNKEEFLERKIKCQTRSPLAACSKSHLQNSPADQIFGLILNPRSCLPRLVIASQPAVLCRVTSPAHIFAYQHPVLRYTLMEPQIESATWF